MAIRWDVSASVEESDGDFVDGPTDRPGRSSETPAGDPDSAVVDDNDG